MSSSSSTVVTAADLAVLAYMVKHRERLVSIFQPLEVDVEEAAEDADVDIASLELDDLAQVAVDAVFRRLSRVVRQDEEEEKEDAEEPGRKRRRT